MERKEIVIENGDLYSAKVTINYDSTQFLHIMQQSHTGDMQTALDKDGATALHSALDEMLNPWRDASELPPSETPISIQKSDGTIVAGYCVTAYKIWYSMLNNEHGNTLINDPIKWKPITLPAKPKD